MQCVSNGDDLKFLLQSKQCHGKLAKSTVGMYTIYMYYKLSHAKCITGFPHVLENSFSSHEKHVENEGKC